jgi:hypothetical protein
LSSFVGSQHQQPLGLFTARCLGARIHVVNPAVAL